MDVVNCIIEAYTTVYGTDKWNSLTAEQQHDVIMNITNKALKSMEE